MSRLIVSSLFWRFVGGTSFYLVQLVTMMVLSRILTPADFGVMTTVLLVYNFLNLFNDAGFRNVIIQRMDADTTEFRKVYGAALLVGALTTMIMIIGSPLAEWIFDDNRLGWPVMVTALTFMFMSTSGITGAVLEKSFRFKTTALVSLCSGLISGATGIALALTGARYWSFVGMLLTKSILDAAILSVLAKIGVPIFDFSRMKSFFKFGGYITFHNLMIYFCKSIEKICISRYDGTVALGYYSRSYTLANVYEVIFPSICVQVLYPLFGKHRDRPDRIRAFYYSALELLFLGGGSAMAVIGVWAAEVNDIVWGAQWALSVPSLILLCFSAIAFTQNMMARMVFVTFYAERKLVYFSAFQAVTTTAACLSVAHYGATIIALAYCVSAWISALAIGIYVGLALMKGSLKTFFGILSRAILSAMLCALLALGGKYFLVRTCGLHPNISFAVFFVVMALAYSLYLFLAKRSLIRTFQSV